MAQIIEGSNYCVSQISTPQHLEQYWPLIEAELDTVPHIWRNRWSKDELLAGVLSSHYQLWAAGPTDCYRMVLFTQIAMCTQGNILQIFLAFGNGFEELFPILEATLTRYAALMECKRIEVIGRAGFEKWLKPFGFEKIAMVFSRDVQPMGVH